MRPEKIEKIGMGSRGVHEIMTTFFLIVLVVSIVLMLIYFNYMGALRESALSEEWYKMQYMTTLRNQIENCLKAYEKNDTVSLLADLNKCIPMHAKGYSLEQIANYDCNYGYFATGDTEHCEQQLIFFTNLPQDFVKSCLVKLRVCLGNIAS